MAKYLRLIDPSEAECDARNGCLHRGVVTALYRTPSGDWPFTPDYAIDRTPVEIPDSPKPQPIETAPRDATPILVWGPKRKGWSPALWSARGLTDVWTQTVVYSGITHWLPMPPTPQPEPEPQAKPIGDVITIEGKKYRVVPVEGSEND